MSDHLDTVKRLVWLEQKWPTIVRAAKRRRGLILFEDEASFAQWGSLSYTWARRGQQPEVPTSGKRKGYTLARLNISLGVSSHRASRVGLIRKVTKRSYK